MISKFKFARYEYRSDSIRERKDPPDEEWYQVDGDLYALWIRVVIPAIDLSMRYGMSGDFEEGDVAEWMLFYPANETEPKNAICSYDYGSYEYVVADFAKKHGYTGDIDDLDCYIDTEEIPGKPTEVILGEKKFTKRQIEVIDFPALKRSSRKREYDLYTDEQRTAVVKAWLFDGLGYREMDEKILGLDRKVSKGYQSMGICHYLGLVNNHQGIFKGISKEEALLSMLAVRDPDVNSIADLLMHA